MGFCKPGEEEGNFLGICPKFGIMWTHVET
jgi:hypothetical protein